MDCSSSLKSRQRILQISCADRAFYSCSPSSYNGVFKVELNMKDLIVNTVQPSGSYLALSLPPLRNLILSGICKPPGGANRLQNIS